MTPRRAICTAFAPASLERSPHRLCAHRTVLSAIPPCHSGHDGHRLSPCPPGGGPPRVTPACGHRPCPQWPPPTPPQWLARPRDTPLPGPHCLLTFTVPAALRPCLRSPHRPASDALCTASSLARHRRAPAARVLGTDLPGGPGGRPPGGRQRQDHPHSHSIVPGGGLSTARTPWRPSRAPCFVPVTALSPLSRARGTDARRHAGRLEPSAPQVWPLPWNGHAPAPPTAPPPAPPAPPLAARSPSPTTGSCA